ncbi:MULTISPECIES: helix-turn-helix domain-containing protein [Paenibacillus]|uniref:helix-turn-helix domain-containing protein n=1 Tax=Paenibacillus TaxID=44249 RepID=UPI002FE08644
MMTKLLMRAQQLHDPDATMQILDFFTPKIKAELYQVPTEHREDLQQDLYVKMIEVIQRFDISD